MNFGKHGSGEMGEWGEMWFGYAVIEFRLRSTTAESRFTNREMREMREWGRKTNDYGLLTMDC
jgi:hypothetical protein